MTLLSVCEMNIFSLSPKHELLSLDIIAGFVTNSENVLNIIQIQRYFM